MLVLGADHAGFALKEYLTHALAKRGIPVEDLGPARLVAGDDYPLVAAAVSRRVRRTTGSFGILACGSGIGMSVVANKHAGIRAALAWNERVAARSRQEEDANILVLPANFLSRAAALRIVDVWLRTPFRRIARYRRRLGEIARIEHTS